MKRRIILRGLGGIPGLRPLTEEDYYALQEYLASLPETPLLTAARYAGYVMDPIGAGILYVQNSDWTPNWLKEALPYVDMALAVAPKVGPKGHKGRKAGQRIPPKVKNASAQQKKWNIDAFGDPNPRGAGEPRYDRNGNVVYNGDVGRPTGGKSLNTSFFGQLVEGELQRILDARNGGTKTTEPAVLLELEAPRRIGASRGRRSAKSVEATYEYWDNSSYPKIPKTRGANWKRNYLSMGSAWINYFKTRIKDYLTRVKTAGDKLVPGLIHQLRTKALSYKKYLMLNGIDPKSVGLDFDINEYGKGGNYSL